MRFERKLVTIAAGAELPYRASDWDDALVTVEAGCVELVSASGLCCRFDTGAILVLAGVRLRRLWNPGPAEVVISATSRISTDEFHLPPGLHV